MLKKIAICIPFLYISLTQSTQWNSTYHQTTSLSTQESSLLFHNWAIYSQLGEEGILDEILKRLDLVEGLFVEWSIFYDKSTSSVRFLADRGWHGVFIDAYADSLDESKKSHQYFRPLSPILCLEEILYFKDVKQLPQVQFIKDSRTVSEKAFDQLADSLFPNREIDILSIDIGGLDYVMLEGLQKKPKIIIVKAGSCWTPIMTTKIPSEIASYGLNQPLAVLVDIAKSQGYEPVCYTGHVFLVRNDLLLPFQEIKKDPSILWMDSWYYYGAKQPSYVSWIMDKRATNESIRLFDPIE